MMNTKNKNSKNKRLLVAVAVFVLLLVGLAAFYILRNQDTGDSAFFNLNLDHLSKTEFVFDNEQFPDWVVAGNTYHDNEDKNESFTAFSVDQCQSGSYCRDLMSEDIAKDQCKTLHDQCEALQKTTDAGHCTIHLYHSNIQISPEEKIANNLKRNAELGIDSQEIGVKTLSMDTPEGDKSYQLHQYHSDNKSGNYKSGVSQGYISLDSGHIDIRAICNESSQLDEVLPVLKAIRLTV